MLPVTVPPWHGRGCGPNSNGPDTLTLYQGVLGPPVARAPAARGNFFSGRSARDYAKLEGAESKNLLSTIEKYAKPDASKGAKPVYGPVF